MADAGFFRGTSADQDGRFKDKEKKLLKTMRFEEALEKKIDMNRVNLDVLKPWITEKINELLGMEDDVVVEYVIGQLEAKEVNPKVMQINITGFLNARHSREFMGELWELMDEAQNARDGIPASMVEKKVNEMGRERRREEVKKEAADDWSNRFASVSGGRYTGVSVPLKEDKEKRREKSTSRERTPPRRKAYDEEEKKKRERDDEEGDRRRREREERRAKEREDEKRRERRDREERRRDRRERDRRDTEKKRRSRSRSPRRMVDVKTKKKRRSASRDSEEDEKRKKKSKEIDKKTDRKDRERKEKKKKEKSPSPPPVDSSSSSSSDSSDSSSSSSDSE